MLSLLNSCLSCLTALFSVQAFSYVCYGALIFGFFVCLLDFFHSRC